MDYEEPKLTDVIIGCVIRVHKELGPGFLESIYRRALLIELGKAGLQVESEKEVVVYYDGQQVGRQRLDIVVEGMVVLELKAVEDLCGAHYAQVRAYLKATGFKAGLLVNFSKARSDFRRVMSSEDGMTKSVIPGPSSVVPSEGR